jgi:protein-tyrosine-phosphatase
MNASRPRRWLFVCTGNICRSPMAEFLAKRLAREAGLPLNAASAGVAAEVGEGPTPEARRALAKRGIADVKHVARQLDEDMLSEADAVYVMTQGHRAAVASRFPELAAKVALLREAAGLPDAEIADPWGYGDDVYEHCAARIQEALEILIKRCSHAENAR